MIYLTCHVTTRLRDHKKNWAEAKFGSYRYGGIGDFNLFHDLT